MWRHLDSCQFQTYLHARPPRVECPTHGVRQVRLPWAEPRARFTTLFERMAIDVLRETDVRGATRILRISWDEDLGDPATATTSTACHGIEYLMTWNSAHIANAEFRPRVERACRALGYEAPVLCTPDELMGRGLSRG
jgi:transposase